MAVNKYWRMLGVLRFLVCARKDQKSSPLQTKINRGRQVQKQHLKKLKLTLFAPGFFP
jgi:hypothetical protein